MLRTIAVSLKACILRITLARVRHNIAVKLKGLVLRSSLKLRASNTKMGEQGPEKAAWGSVYLQFRGFYPLRREYNLLNCG